MAASNLLEQKLQDIVASAGGSDDLRPPDDCRDKLGWYLDLIGELLRAGNGSVGGGVTAHRLLSGRDAADQHPMSAITGLQTALNYLSDTISLHKTSAADHEDIRGAVNNLQTAVNNLNIPNLVPYRTASAQDEIDSQIKQSVTDVKKTADEAVKPAALNEYAKKTDIPDIDKSIEEHNEDKTAHGIDELLKTIEGIETGSGSVQSITNAEIQEILNKF